MIQFGDKVREARFLKMLGIKQTANMFGVAPCYLSRIENNKEPATMGLIKSALRCEFINEEEAKEYLLELKERHDKCRKALSERCKNLRENGRFC